MRVDPILARRLVIAAAATGLLVRLAFGLLYWVGKPLTHDEREYLALAQSVAAGRGFTYEPGRDVGTTQQYGRAPAYPFFLALIGAGGQSYDSSPARVKAAQSLVGAAAVLLIAALAWRLGGPGASAAAAWIAALYPPLVWLCAYVLSEALYCTFALATVLLVDRALDRPHTSRRYATAAGLLCGVSVLARPAMLLFLPLAAVWLAWRRRGAVAILFIVTAILAIAPWTIRNYRTYGRLVLVASEGGVTFWTGNHPLARGEGDLAANPDLKLAEIAFRTEHPGLTAEQLEPLYYRDALRHIAQHPLWWAGLLARKLFYTFVPVGPSYKLHSRLYATASIVSYLLLVPFAAAGARAKGRADALFVLAAAAVIACVLFFPQERFRIPVIDPTLIVCAGLLAADRS
jgi:4-amino-4-deoxy-L-arabinose transferase-like glycosyltransferase